MNDLTYRQQQLYRFVRAYLEKHGYAPLLKECAHSMNRTGNGAVHREVTVLVEKGYLAWDRRSLRTLRLPASQNARQDARVPPTPARRVVESTALPTPPRHHSKEA